MSEHLYTPMTPELLCSNIEDSLTFYTNILGFSIQYARPENGFAMLERQGSRIMLDEFEPDSSRSWIAAPLEKPFGRGINLQIETKSVDDLYACVQEANAQIFLPIEEKWYRADDIEVGTRQFIVMDPDGYMLRFFEDLGERPYIRQ
ncbi:MAG: VOC family protein [Alphaproteobacteria bacterium]|nr:VOC family protein [Alphaproteobacteria bacterium]